MIEKPLISIIVPVYNVELYIERCLDSLIGQTYENIEILLINDSSTDGSGKICDRYAKLDPRVLAIHLPENRGVSHARNRGLERARGSLTAFVDPDDYVKLNMLERMYQKLVEDEADVCVCGIVRVDTRENVISVKGDDVFQGTCLELFFAMLRQEAFMGLGGTLCRTETARKCLFNEEIYYGEDTFFFYQLNRYVKRVTRAAEGLYYYVCRDGSATQVSFNERRCTEVRVYAYFCREAREKFPQMLPLLEGRALFANIRLAVGAVESKTLKGHRLLRYLREFHENTRCCFNKKALVECDRLCFDKVALPGRVKKKMVAEMVLLYINAELFWVVTALYKRMKKILCAVKRCVAG